MNFEQVLGYCQAVGAKVVANDLVFRQAVPDLYLGPIKRFKARLVKNLSQPEPPKIEPTFQGAEKVDPPRPETHQGTDPAKMKLLVEVKKLERQAGLAGIDSVKFKVEELADWPDRILMGCEL